MRYTVHLLQDPDGGYVAIVPALPGCLSQGQTRDEACDNIHNAIALYLADCVAADEPVPVEAEHDVITVDVNLNLEE